MADVAIEKYIELYNKSVSISQLKPLSNQTYKVFKASGVDIRVADRTKVYEDPMAYQKIKHFVGRHQYFYMIPVTTIKGTIVGFILRNVVGTKDYSTISRMFPDYMKQVPLMFGFDSSFKEYDKAEKPYPIIVCEGCKDCLMLKRFYPYVLANNTSSMGLNAPILRNISNRFLLAYDNDKAGKEGIERDKKVLRNLGAYTEGLVLDDGFKDCADYEDHPTELRNLLERIKRHLRRLSNYS